MVLPDIHRGSVAGRQPSFRYRLCLSADMTRKAALFTIGIALLTMSFAQVDKPAKSDEKQEIFPLRTISHNAFKPGEKLTYILHYGFMNAGEATLELSESDKDIQGRKVLHAVGKGRSLGAFNTFYKVDDHYETFFDR